MLSRKTVLISSVSVATVLLVLLLVFGPVGLDLRMHRALASKDRVVAEEAIEKLIDQTDNWQQALVRLLKDRNLRVRAIAARHMGLRGGEEDRQLTFLPALVSALDDNSRLVRETAAVSIAFIQSTNPEHSKRILPILIDALDNPEICGDACFALVFLEDKASPAVPKIAKLLDSPIIDTRRSAAYALTFLDPNLAASSEGVIEMFIKILNTESPYNRMRAAECLERLGPAAKQAIPALLQAKSYFSPWVTDAANSALSKIDPETYGYLSNDPEEATPDTPVEIPETPTAEE